MSLRSRTVDDRPEINITSGSTLQHLALVGLVCAFLWSAIAVMVSA